MTCKFSLGFLPNLVRGKALEPVD
uniref:Uncharacterized protein n=1 Tax=Anguilla anguilla TaxID=7936 RepID=A0A0E9TRE1_ANGAN